MTVLALDSSADMLAVALVRAGEVCAERSRRAARPSSEGLLPWISEVVSDAGTALAEVTLVAVATGPGSFNGIRGGIATARGLALALDVPAVGVPTLDALAYAHAGRAPVIAAVLRAGRDDVYTARYEGTWSTWRRCGEYAVSTVSAVLENLARDSLLCGHIDAETVQAAAMRGIACAPPFTAASRATVVAALGERRFQDGGFDSEMSLRPLYLRRPGITAPTRPLVGVAPGGEHGETFDATRGRAE